MSHRIAKLRFSVIEHESADENRSSPKSPAARKDVARYFEQVNLQLAEYGPDIAAEITPAKVAAAKNGGLLKKAAAYPARSRGTRELRLHNTFGGGIFKTEKPRGVSVSLRQTRACVYASVADLAAESRKGDRPWA